MGDPEKENMSVVSDTSTSTMTSELSSSSSCAAFILDTFHLRSLRSVGRILLSVHFATELYDKVMHFEYWSRIVAESNGSGKRNGILIARCEMSLVVALLLVGAPLLFLGISVRLNRMAIIALVIFQLPTTIMFESQYDIFDSISVLGGLCYCYDDDKDYTNREGWCPHPIRRNSPWRDDNESMATENNPIDRGERESLLPQNH